MDGSAPARMAQTPKRIHAKITYQRELFRDIWHEVGRLFILHDKDVWPNRTWGPLAPDVLGYLTLEQQNKLAIITARAGTAKRLIGYTFDVVTAGHLHYSKTSHAHCDLVWMHSDYRVGKGLSVRKSPGFRLLQERERMLDGLKIVRRRIDPKIHRNFGGLLRILGYAPEAIIHQKIVLAEDD